MISDIAKDDIAMDDIAPLPSFDFHINMNDITLGQVIGKGSFSTVYLGKYLGDHVAVKKQTREKVELEHYHLRELAMLKSCKHDNLVKYIGAYDVNNSLYIVMEYCHGGDLSSLLTSDRQLGFKFRIKIALESGSAIKYLHENNYLHRDIKSSNFLLDKNYNCKLADFGLSKMIHVDPTTTRSSTRHSVVGTSEYMAPEILFEEDYNSEIDIFSFGLVLLEIITRKLIGVDGFAIRKPNNKFHLDFDSIFEHFPANSPTSLNILARECLSYEGSSRPTAADLVEWLEDLNNDFEDDNVPYPTLNTTLSIDGSNNSTPTESGTVMRNATKSLYDQYSLREVNSSDSISCQDASNTIGTNRDVSYFQDVTTWLSSIDPSLTTYANEFMNKGYSISIIQRMGISDEDLRSIGVANSLHRMLIRRSIGEIFTDTLKLAIKHWRDFNGVTVYKVVSHLRFSRSSVYLRFNDFKEFDVMIKKKLKVKLPPLPTEGIMRNQKDSGFLEQRMADLELYLMESASILDKGNFTLLLNFLELIPQDDR